MRFVKAFLSVSFLFLIITSAQGQGTVIDDEVYSPILNEDRMVDVYLPPGYVQENEGVRYPVIYYLHGGYGNQNSEAFIADAADELILNGAAPFIIVKPSCYDGPYNGMSWFANSELYGFYEDFITQDLITYIDSTYNTIPDREFRGIMGFSMGGFGAFMIGLKHPDIYCGTVAHSGALSLETEYNENVPIMMNENGGSGPFDPQAGTYSMIMYSLGGAFSPNMDNPPHYIDLPCDNDGNRIDEVWARWQLQDPSTLILDFEPEDDFGIYFDCGYSDHMLSSSIAFNNVIQDLEIPYQYHNYDGNHTSLDLRFPVSLAYMDSLFWYGIPRAEEINLDPSYIMDVEEVDIVAEIVNENNLSISLTARIETLEGDHIDVVELFDDGNHGDGDADDDVYGGTWAINVDISDMRVSLFMIEEGTGAEFAYADCARMTRRGPVVVSNINTLPEGAIPQPGGVVFLQPEIMNQDGGTTINNIVTRIENPSDYLTLTGNVISVDSLEANGVIVPFGALMMSIDAACPVDTSFVFEISVSSEGYEYWVDQFIIEMGETLGVEEEEPLPERAKLSRIYPNPFNGTTQVSMELFSETDLEMVLYNLLGKEVHRGYFENRPAGVCNLPVDLNDFSTGTYFLKIVAGGEHIKTAKVMLMK